MIRRKIVNCDICSREIDKNEDRCKFKCFTNEDWWSLKNGIN